MKKFSLVVLLLLLSVVPSYAQSPDFRFGIGEADLMSFTENCVGSPSACGVGETGVITTPGWGDVRWFNTNPNQSSGVGAVIGATLFGSLSNNISEGGNINRITDQIPNQIQSNSHIIGMGQHWTHCHGFGFGRADKWCYSDENPQTTPSTYQGYEENIWLLKAQIPGTVTVEDTDRDWVITCGQDEEITGTTDKQDYPSLDPNDNTPDCDFTTGTNMVFSDLTLTQNYIYANRFIPQGRRYRIGFEPGHNFVSPRAYAYFLADMGRIIMEQDNDARLYIGDFDSLLPRTELTPFIGVRDARAYWVEVARIYADEVPLNRKPPGGWAGFWIDAGTNLSSFPGGVHDVIEPTQTDWGPRVWNNVQRFLLLNVYQPLHWLDDTNIPEAFGLSITSSPSTVSNTYGARGKLWLWPEDFDRVNGFESSNNQGRNEHCPLGFPEHANPFDVNGFESEGLVSASGSGNAPGYYICDTTPNDGNETSALQYQADFEILLLHGTYHSGLNETYSGTTWDRRTTFSGGLVLQVLAQHFIDSLFAETPISLFISRTFYSWPGPRTDANSCINGWPCKCLSPELGRIDTEAINIIPGSTHVSGLSTPLGLITNQVENGNPTWWQPEGTSYTGNQGYTYSGCYEIVDSPGGLGWTWPSRPTYVDSTTSNRLPIGY